MLGVKLGERLGVLLGEVLGAELCVGARVPMMGLLEGRELGLTEGTLVVGRLVGEFVGIGVGAAVGLLVGEFVGAGVGAAVGLPVGEFVGAGVGAAVGLRVGGRELGILLGAELGSLEGIDEGESDGWSEEETSRRPIAWHPLLTTDELYVCKNELTGRFVSKMDPV